MKTESKNLLHPKKLLLTKWTAVKPEHKEKHFIVVKLILPEQKNSDASLSIEQVVIEAVMSKRQQTIFWKSLRDTQIWKQGWVD
jgi:tryptophan-rich hypothetical protein